METILCQGAEATIIMNDGLLLKKRVAKSYRVSQLDNTLRLSRTRKEKKALLKAKELNIPVPNLHRSDDKYVLVMDFIKGERLRDVASKDNSESANYFKEVGIHLSTLHQAGLIHGDLTTSNILIAEKLYFIDFGLSFFSDKIEDMAVDIHLLEEALESTHYLHSESFFSHFLKGYKSNPVYDKVIKRLEVVRLRGRNKH